MFVIAQPLLTLFDSVYPALPLSFLAGIGWTACMTTLNVAMQVRSPEEILGRCLAIYQAITFGGMALGAWLWGAVADWVSVPTALNGAAVWLVVTVGLLRLLGPMPAPHEGRIA